MAATGSKPFGERAILSQDPHDRARTSKRSPAAVAHAATVATWLAMKIAHREFVFAYREAAERFRRTRVFLFEVEFTRGAAEFSGSGGV